MCDKERGRVAHPTYHRTRAVAMQAVCAALDRAIAAGERVFLGFDFGFGYPAGFARALTGQPDALAVWDWLEREIVDGADNANNRFDVAAAINTRFGGVGPFWGCPNGRDGPDLPARGSLRHGHGLPDRRAVELVVKSAQSGFKLFTTGSVGSQSLLGLPHLARLRRRYAEKLAVWPLQTGWILPDAAIVLAEIYPSLFKSSQLIPLTARYPGELYHIPDAVQVMTVCDVIGNVPDSTFARGFECPAGLPDATRIAREEGWIFGAGLGKTSA